MRRIVISTSSSGLDNLKVNTKVNTKVDLIRLRMFINNVEFIDGKNITTKGLHQLMTGVSCSAIHTQPAPETEVLALFNDLLRQGYEEVFVTTLSSKLSESFDIIKKVAAGFQGRMKIYVYDCLELNVCEGLLALEAEHLLNEGESMPRIAQRLDELRANHKMLFAVDDLSYLIKNKKLSSAAGFFANILNIKPVLQVTEGGEIIAVNKIRKFERALDHIIDDFSESLQQHDSFAYVLSAGFSQLASS